MEKCNSVLAVLKVQSDRHPVTVSHGCGKDADHLEPHKCVACDLEWGVDLTHVIVD